jgi:hypothetical protein
LVFGYKKVVVSSKALALIEPVSFFAGGTEGRKDKGESRKQLQKLTL